MTNQTYVRTTDTAVRYFRIVNVDGDLYCVTGTFPTSNPKDNLTVGHAIQCGRGRPKVRVLDRTAACKAITNWRKRCRAQMFLNERYVAVTGVLYA